MPPRRKSPPQALPPRWLIAEAARAAKEAVEELERVQSSPKLSPYPVFKERTERCRCGKPCQLDSQFCTECGQSLSAKCGRIQERCRCGKPCLSDAQYCTDCGQGLGQKRSQSQVGVKRQKNNTKLTTWRCQYKHGVDVRGEPAIDGFRMPHALDQGEEFMVEREELGKDGILYLKLADGRGWVFDQKPNLGVICARCEAPSKESRRAKSVREPSPKSPKTPKQDRGRNQRKALEAAGKETEKKSRSRSRRKDDEDAEKTSWSRSRRKDGEDGSQGRQKEAPARRSERKEVERPQTAGQVSRVREASRCNQKRKPRPEEPAREGRSPGRKVPLESPGRRTQAFPEPAKEPAREGRSPGRKASLESLARKTQEPAREGRNLGRKAALESPGGKAKECAGKSKPEEKEPQRSKRQAAEENPRSSSPKMNFAQREEPCRRRSEAARSPERLEAVPVTLPAASLKPAALPAAALEKLLSTPPKEAAKQRPRPSTASTLARLPEHVRALLAEPRELREPRSRSRALPSAVPSEPWKEPLRRLPEVEVPVREFRAPVPEVPEVPEVPQMPEIQEISSDCSVKEEEMTESEMLKAVEPEMLKTVNAETEMRSMQELWAERERERYESSAKEAWQQAQQMAAALARSNEAEEETAREKLAGAAERRKAAEDRASQVETALSRLREAAVKVQRRTQERLNSLQQQQQAAEEEAVLHEAEARKASARAEAQEEQCAQRLQSLKRELDSDVQEAEMPLKSAQEAMFAHVAKQKAKLEGEVEQRMVKALRQARAAQKQAAQSISELREESARKVLEAARASEEAAQRAQTAVEAAKGERLRDQAEMSARLAKAESRVERTDQKLMHLKISWAADARQKFTTVARAAQGDLADQREVTRKKQAMMEENANAKIESTRQLLTETQALAGAAKDAARAEVLSARLGAEQAARDSETRRRVAEAGLAEQERLCALEREAAQREARETCAALAQRAASAQEAGARHQREAWQAAAEAREAAAEAARGAKGRLEELRAAARAAAQEAQSWALEEAEAADGLEAQEESFLSEVRNLEQAQLQKDCLSARCAEQLRAAGLAAGSRRSQAEAAAAEAAAEAAARCRAQEQRAEELEQQALAAEEEVVFQDLDQQRRLERERKAGAGRLADTKKGAEQAEVAIQEAICCSQNSVRELYRYLQQVAQDGAVSPDGKNCPKCRISHTPSSNFCQCCGQSLGTPDRMAMSGG